MLKAVVYQYILPKKGICLIGGHLAKSLLGVIVRVVIKFSLASNKQVQELRADYHSGNLEYLSLFHLHPHGVTPPPPLLVLA